MSHLISTTRGRELISIIRVDDNRIADVTATAELERKMRAAKAGYGAKKAPAKKRAPAKR